MMREKNTIDMMNIKTYLRFGQSDTKGKAILSTFDDLTSFLVHFTYMIYEV